MISIKEYFTAIHFTPPFSLKGNAPSLSERWKKDDQEAYLFFFHFLVITELYLEPYK
jgi:hypothetical protein